MIFFHKNKTDDQLKKEIKELKEELSIAQEKIDRPEKIFNNLDWSSLFDEPKESGMVAMLPWINTFMSAIILIILFVKK